MADMANLLRVLIALDNGVFQLMVERYGGLGLIVGNRFRYELSLWYLAAIEKDPGFYGAHDQIAVVSLPDKQARRFTCECGAAFELPDSKVANFGNDEFVVYHQLDWALQRLAPKDRPQWWQYQG